MGLRINQNVEALNAYRNLSVTSGAMAKSLEKLSSGYRINRAADDAAGLSISEGLRAQIGGTKVAVRNAQDGISVVQTAEGALTETHAILQRLRDLAVQSANDSNDADSRTAISAEKTKLVEELDRISAKTTFNNVTLLDGSYTGKKYQVGYASGDVIDVAITATSTTPGNLSFTNGGITASTTGTLVFTQGTTVVTTGSVTGSTNANTLAANLNADANFKAVFTASVKSDGGLLIQANSTTNTAGISVAAGTGTLTGGTTNAAVTGTGGFSSTSLGINDATLLMNSQVNATAAINLLDNAIKTVSTARAGLGALQNRFEHTINNLNVAVENLSASESRIRDTDMASEMVSFTRSQILSQAGTAMLAQANQAPQNVLQLLR